MSKMKNIKIPIFVIDFEGSRKIGIVEYGVAKICGGEIVSTATNICAPRTNIPLPDSNFFNITTSTAIKFPPFEEHLQYFCNMRKSGIFAAHNAVAEDTMLRDALPVAPIGINPLTRTQTTTWAPYIDTCTLAKTLFKLKSVKLADVIKSLSLEDELNTEVQKYCPIDRRKWHCALFDAIASALILIKICSFEGFENVTLEWLLKYSKPSQDTQQNLL